MSNIIDSIRLSGTTYQIQGSGGGITVDPTLDSGSTNPVANSAITTALDDKVNVADNNASAYTFVNKISNAEYGYSEHFAGPIYIRYTGPSSSSGNNHYAGYISCYISELELENIYLYFNFSNGQITSTTVSSDYFDIEIENGEAVLTFKNGYYLMQYNSQNEFVALTKTTYESGQSANVIEDTVYDVFDKLNDKVDKIGDNAVNGGHISFNKGYLESILFTNKTDLYSFVKIDSSTIKSSNDGLSVQFANSEVADRILNVGSDSYGELFSTSSYNTSFNEFTITFNPNCTQYGVYYFSVRIIDASNAMYYVTFEYNSSDMSAVYTGLTAYCTVTDTLSTDYKLKVTAKEGYKIARLHNGNYMVGGVDNTNPNSYISNLVTTPSYVHDGQDVIDDIYDKLDDKQDTLQSGTNIKTVNNQSLLGSGNIDIQGGGKAIEAGRGISITTGETADTVSFNLPISANTNNSVVMGGKINSSFTNNGRDCLMVGSHLTGNNGSDCSLVVGYNSSVNGDGSAVIGWGSSSTGDSAFAFGTYVSAKTHYSFATGYGTVTNNQYEYASGRNNVSNTGSTDADKTLFSVGNGTSNNARHNAFEIRKNGDIYLTLDGQDVKLQDQLGGSSITVDTALDSGSTNPVQNQALYSELRIDNGETETTLAFEDSESTNYPNGCTKLNVEVVGSDGVSDIRFFNDDEPLGHIRIDNMGGVINVNVDFDGASYEISGTTVIITYPTVTSVTKIRVDGIGNYVYKAITSLTTPLKDKVAANTTALGGLSLIKLTQAQYDALVTKDNSTLYVIVN